MATPARTDEWLPKADAAEFLGVSTREIERKAASGRIGSKRVRLEGERTDRTVYSAADIGTVKREKEAGTMQLATRPPDNFLAAALTAILARDNAPAGKPWMTIEEAAAYSGLHVTTLKALVRSGDLLTFGRGTKRRVSRVLIDNLAATLGMA